MATIVPMGMQYRIEVAPPPPIPGALTRLIYSVDVYTGTTDIVLHLTSPFAYTGTNQAALSTELYLDINDEVFTAAAGDFTIEEDLTDLYACRLVPTGTGWNAFDISETIRLEVIGDIINTDDGYVRQANITAGVFDVGTGNGWYWVSATSGTAYFVASFIAPIDEGFTEAQLLAGWTFGGALTGTMNHAYLTEDRYSLICYGDTALWGSGTNDYYNVSYNSAVGGLTSLGLLLDSSAFLDYLNSVKWYGQ